MTSESLSAFRPEVGWPDWTVFPRSSKRSPYEAERNAGFLAQVRLPDFAALLPRYEGFFGFCGWMVSPAASIVTNFSILAARVSGFLALCTR